MIRPIRSLALLILFSAIASAAFAQDENSAKTAQRLVSQSDVRRFVSLEERGYDTGAQIKGLGASEDFYFAVSPDGLTEAQFQLDYQFGSTFEGRRSLQIALEGRTVLTRELPEGNEQRSLVVPLDPAMMSGDFARLTVTLSGAITEDRCVDQRVSGDFLTIEPSSGLHMIFKPGAVDELEEVAPLLPSRSLILLPEGPLNGQEAATVLRLASLLRADEGGVEIRSANNTERNADLWTRAVFQLMRSDDNQERDGNATEGRVQSEGSPPALKIEYPFGSPVIVIDIARSDLALRPLSAAMRAPNGARPLSPNRLKNGFRDRLTFAELGANVFSADVVDRTVFSQGFSILDIAGGGKPTSISLDVAVSTDIQETDAVIALFLNDRLLASRSTQAAVPVRLEARIPDGLIVRENMIRVVVQRQPQTGNCSNPPMGYPVQVMPSSFIGLEDETASPQDFHELVRYFADGVTVHLPDADPRNLSENIGPIAQLVASVVAPEVPIEVSFDPLPDDPSGPFILIAKQAPGVIEAPISFDKGRVALVSGALAETADVEPALQNREVLQIVLKGEESGLWLRQNGERLEPIEGPLLLDQGNIAVIDQTGTSLAFTTMRDSFVEVAYPDAGSWFDIVRQYRNWLIGAAWLVITLLFVAALARFYRNRES